jgi:hypothetical protein
MCLCDGCGRDDCMTCNPAFGRGADVPVLAACACKSVHNVPSHMSDEPGRYWIECGCGKSTSTCKTEDEARAQWRLIAGG